MLNVDLRKNMNVTNIIKNNICVVLETNNGKIKLEPCSDSIINIIYTNEENFSEKKSLGVIKKNLGCKWSTEEDDLSLKIKTNLITLVVSKESAAITYLDNKGNLLVREPKDGGKVLDKFEIFKTVIDENTIIKKIQTPDGEKTIISDGNKVYDRIAYHTKLSFEFAANEALYGLGQHEEGSMNLRGTSQYLHQANLKIPMPVILSTKGYGILVDTYSGMTFHDDKYGSYIWTDTDDEMDFYFIYGPTFDNIIKGYRSLTGKVPMLPKWAFGYVQSQERYETQEEILNTVKRYRLEQIPLDLIVLDWQSWTGNLWGQKTFDPTRFPDPKAMTDELHELGSKFMISVWPNMSTKCDNYIELHKANLIIKGSDIYNAFLEKAQKLYWKQANEGLFSKGVDAWWCDSSEPFTPEWDGEVNPEPETKFNMYLSCAKKLIDPQYTNAFPLMHAKGIYEGQRNTSDKKRVVNLTRASYIGGQRYSTVLWSGDTSAKWETLQKQIPAGLNFCATGIPYWTLDIGAFFVKKGSQWFWNGDYDGGTEDLGYRELYTRWFQLGAFLPMFRSHGTDTRREVWQFGKKGEMFYDTIVKFDKLRYKLIPYIYSLAAMVTMNDYTILRALAFEFQNDIKVYDIKDQFMFGSALMICPVTTPMYYDKDSVKLYSIEKVKSVYLPSGSTWYDFWTNKKYDGGVTVIANAEIGIIPIFVKGGSILPTGPDIQYTSQKNDNPITLNIYSGANAEFTLYDDEGDNYNYEKGAFSTINLTCDNKESYLTIGNCNGKFSGMVTNREFEINLISNLSSKTKSVKYCGESIKIFFK